MELTRRELIRTSVAGLLTLSMKRLSIAQSLPAAPAVAPPVPLPDYRAWEDLYRKVWTWDSVARATHYVNCWYQGHCSFNVYVKDGIAWREEQTAIYPRTNADVPDYNPRGCQKGACYTHQMYLPSRIKYPLKRAGERGEGKWIRLSWDEALTEVADAFIDVLVDEGADRWIWSIGSAFLSHVNVAGLNRLCVLTDTASLDLTTEIGDHHNGVAQTFGKNLMERSGDDYFYSDLILIWGANPIYTQIPNAHFFTEARYRGAKLVTIAPDYSASAIHADAWVPIEVGTDAALALAMCHVIVNEKLYNESFVVEQTDLPLLVKDDGTFLRQSDRVAGGRDDRFYCFDTATKTVVDAPHKTLRLGGIRPALRGKWTVAGHDEKSWTVTTVFEHLAKLLEQYSPEKAQKVTTVPPATARSLAREIARAKAVSNVTSANFGRLYHGNLMERSIILLLALCGHMGRKGAGYSGFPWLQADGVDTFALLDRSGLPGPEAQAMGQAMEQLRAAHDFTDEMATAEIAHSAFAQGAAVAGALFWYLNGLSEVSGRSKEWDPYLKRPVDDYVRESLQKGWQFGYPKAGQPPLVLVEWGGNILRRVRAYPYLLKNLWPKLKLMVVIDPRMSSTGLFADIVLPAAGFYERTDVVYATPLNPYLHAGTAAVQPLAESKPDFEIMARLTRKISERARLRGKIEYKDKHGATRRLDTLFQDFSMDGALTETDCEKVAAQTVTLSSNLKDVAWEDMRTRGFARHTGVGHSQISIGNATDFIVGETISPLTNHVQGKKPYPSGTRRIQFYLDHPLHLELGETLPVHKDPPNAGGRYPLRLTGGHTRWGIHSLWRDSEYMQRLRRGRPVMFISIADAKARNIADGDEIRVFNDLDHFFIEAVVSPAVRPGQTLVYHAWENYQFRDGKGYQNLIPTPLNPVELAGGGGLTSKEGHLRALLMCLHPAQSNGDTTVDIAKA